MASPLKPAPFGGRPSFAEKAAAFRAEEEVVGRAQSGSLLALSQRLASTNRMQEALEAARLAAVLAPGSGAALNDAAILAFRTGDLSALLNRRNSAGTPLASVQIVDPLAKTGTADSLW